MALAKVGGLGGALQILGSKYPDNVRENAALALSTSSSDHGNAADVAAANALCEQILALPTKDFRRLVDCVKDKNKVVRKAALNTVCNCTYVELDDVACEALEAKLEATDAVEKLVDMLSYSDTQLVTAAATALGNLSCDIASLRDEARGERRERGARERGTWMDGRTDQRTLGGRDRGMGGRQKGGAGGCTGGGN